MKRELTIFLIWLTIGWTGPALSLSVENKQLLKTTGLGKGYVISGEHLRIVLTGWSKEMGGTLVRNVPCELYTSLPLMIQESCEDIIDQVRVMVSRTNREIDTILNRGNKVVIILSRNLLS